MWSKWGLSSFYMSLVPWPQWWIQRCPMSSPLWVLKWELPSLMTESWGCKFAAVVPRPAGWQSLSADRKDEDHPRGNSTKVGQGKPRWRASLFSSESFSAALPVLLRAWEISSLWLSELLQNPTNKFPICLSYLEFFHWPFYKVLGWELGQSIIIECSPEITP